MGARRQGGRGASPDVLLPARRARTLFVTATAEGGVSAYRHTQIGLVVIAALVGSIVLVLGLALIVERHPVVFVVVLMLVAALALFYSLSVEIRGSELIVSFGIGFPHFTYELSQIREARVVRNPWFYGWGIHMTPDGWLYNVSGFLAVEIVFVDGRRIRIGTDEPNELYRAVVPYARHLDRR